jgi:hypothetical protein
MKKFVLLVGLIALAGIGIVGCGKQPPEAPAVPKGNVAEHATPGDKGIAQKDRLKRSGSKSRPGTTVNDNDPNLLDWNQRLTALRKIRAGMTIEQVEGILGMADESDDDNDPSGVLAKRGETLTILTWRGDDPSDDGDFIMIGFVNERIKDRSSITVNAARR